RSLPRMAPAAAPPTTLVASLAVPDLPSTTGPMASSANDLPPASIESYDSTSLPLPDILPGRCASATWPLIFEPAGNTTLPSTLTSSVSVPVNVSPTTLSLVLTSASTATLSAVPAGTTTPGASACLEPEVEAFGLLAAGLRAGVLLAGGGVLASG